MRRPPPPGVAPNAVDRAAAFVRVLGDTPRFSLPGSERCVTEKVEADDDKFSTVSREQSGRTESGLRVPSSGG